MYIYILASAIKFLEMGGYPKWRGSVFEMGGGVLTPLPIIFTIYESS